MTDFTSHKIDISKLYDSECCSLAGIVVNGKKQIGGILHFKGHRTVLGSGKAVRALTGGVVVMAGRDTDIHSRAYRLGIAVTIYGDKGVAITCGRLASRSVNVGERVEAGDVIGIEGDTGAGADEFLLLEFRRNGRRIDGCDYLGIPREPAEFTPKSTSPADAVARRRGLTPICARILTCIPTPS